MVVPLSFDATVRRAKHSDLESIMAIETVGWPLGESMRADAEKFVTRIECGFVWLACDSENSVLGMFTAFRPKWIRAERIATLLQACPNEIFDQNILERWQSLCREYGFFRNWHDATADGTLENGSMHNPEGDVLYGVGLVVRPEYKGTGLARFLLQSALAEAATTGVLYFLGYGRLPNFYRFQQTDVDTYLRMTLSNTSEVRPLDPQLRFHWSMGARPIRSIDHRYRYVGIPGSMREDAESRDHGLLITAPIGAQPFPLECLAP